MHVENLKVEGDVNYKTTTLVLEIDMQEEQGFVQQHSFTQKLFSNGYVPWKYNPNWLTLAECCQHVNWFH